MGKLKFAQFSMFIRAPCRVPIHPCSLLRAPCSVLHAVSMKWPLSVLSGFRVLRVLMVLRLLRVLMVLMAFRDILRDFEGSSK